MPRASAISLEPILDRANLTWAAWRAAKGHRHQPEVRALLSELDSALNSIYDDLLNERAPGGPWARFVIHDPKRRVILAPCFRDRVVHHAMMRHLGPVLDRSLVDDTFACRTGKGTHAAVHRLQHHLRRWPWAVKVDVRQYFASIDRGRLLLQLRRQFKHPAVLQLWARVVLEAPGTGLPIGALTSQYLANSYLSPLDHALLAQPEVRGMVRYMDDLVWLCETRAAARASLAFARSFTTDHLGLQLKPSAQVVRSKDGLSFLGYRVFRGCLRLGQRRRQRFRAALRRIQAQRDLLSDRQLQQALEGALSITAHADARSWRRAELRQRGWLADPPEPGTVA